jgi:hypothetical protein
LQRVKSVKYVPWVLNPCSDHYDVLKAAKQEVKDELLADLEKTIREASA